MPFGTSGNTITSRDGHDIAYTTTNRPTNMTVGQMGYNTTTGRVEIANGTDMNNITDVASSSATTGAGGDNALIAGGGGPGSGTSAGGVGGTAVLRSGAGGVKADTGTAAGGAAGLTTVAGGAGGATAGTGISTGGAGGGVAITGGVGGAAQAGTGSGGVGGSVTITPGAGGGTVGGSVGAIGSIILAGPVSSPVTAAQALVTGNTITLPTSGLNKLVTCAAAVTGAIMTAGRFDGDEVCLLNNSANSCTFAAAGTSKVADGASAVIAANTSMRLVYSTSAALWFHGN
jgi:hypothetical protein